MIRELWDKEIDASENKTEIVRIVLIVVNEYESLFDYVFNNIDKKSWTLKLEILNLFSKLNKTSSKLNLKLDDLIRTYSAQNSSDFNLMMQFIDIYNFVLISAHKQRFNETNLNTNLDCILKASYLFQIFASKLSSKDTYLHVLQIVNSKIEALKSFEVCLFFHFIY